MIYDLQYSEGCSFSTTINGKELVDFTETPEGKAELKKLILALVEKVDVDVADLQMLFMGALTQIGTYEDEGYCEQCGSSNFSYKAKFEVDD
jgi:hypothetical protein